MKNNLFTQGQFQLIKGSILSLDTNKVKIEKNQNCDYFDVKSIWILGCSLSSEYSNEINNLYINNPAQLCSTLSTYLQNSAFEGVFTEYQRGIMATVLNMANESEGLFFQYVM